MRRDQAVLIDAGIRRGLIDERGIQFRIHFGARVQNVAAEKGHRLFAQKDAVFVKQGQRRIGPDKGVVGRQDHRRKTEQRIGRTVDVDNGR